MIEIVDVIASYHHLLGLPALSPCARCGEQSSDVTWHQSRTAYVWDGTGLDPNHPSPLCPSCRRDDVEYWDDMWADYYSGLL